MKEDARTGLVLQEDLGVSFIWGFEYNFTNTIITINIIIIIISIITIIICIISITMIISIHSE